MRQFDAFNSYVGEGGKPLVGRILFYDTDSQPKSVYDADGTDLGYKISVELCGRASKQVFLDDVDYIVTFQQKNGDGSYYSIGSVLNKMPELNIIGDQASGPVPSVATKSALVNLDPAGITAIGGKKIVQMLGYNAAGDKPSVYYWWNADSVASDNGGSVIGSGVSVTGRWEIIASFEDVDSRHFGMFPKTDSIDTYVDGYLDHRNRVSQLATYAYSMSKKVYFPNVGNQNAWYDIGGSTIYGAVTDDNIVLAVSHGFAATVTNAQQNTKFKSILNTSYNGGTISVSGKILKTSQDLTDNTSTYDSTTQTWTDSKTRSRVSLNPSETLIVDTQYTASNKHFLGINVLFAANWMINTLTELTFYACNFLGKYKVYLNGITKFHFYNCKIGGNQFDISSVQAFNVATFGSCGVESADWSSNTAWFNAQKNIANSNVIDMTGRNISETIPVKGAIKVKGGNWSGTLSIWPTGSVSVEEANITGTLNFQSTSQSISLKRCKVATLSGGCSKLTAYDCEFTSATNFEATVLDFDWCVLNCNFTGLSGSSISNCEINQNLIINSSENAGSQQIYNIVIASNIFNNTAGISITGSSDSSNKTFVNNVWVHDNQVNGSGVLLATGYFDEVLGSYRFENNYGNLVQWRETKLAPKSYVNKDMGAMNGGNVSVEIGNPGGTENSLVTVVRPCLRDLVFNFGERYNLCNYGFHFLNTRCQMKWTTGYSGGTLDTIQLGSSDDFNTGRIWWQDEKAVEQTFSILGTAVGHTSQNDLTTSLMPQVRTNNTRYQSYGDTNNVRMNIKVIPCEQ